ncbi:bifunctional Ham1-like protein/Inosine triphosphate pyrophosphatase-like [Babesia duncani]|uniref:XTP/dITP diphosphatase n=1 Tax=Babesia duncani TaxID=323732 RepID=A0AAD9PJC9_9APIC|nr:bifunctional Ham1-like protein/Inosine triphosphate pyrophosphatase-like [Babesia duncani]
MIKMEKWDVIFCTSNLHKVQDMQCILGDQFNVIQHDVDLCEIQGNPESIIRHKCIEAYKLLKKPLIVEDTCLGFNAFNGLPGPYIKYFLVELGAENIYKLLAEFDDKSGFAMCSIGYVDENGIEIFHHKTMGDIVKSRGSTEFGWNSIFQPHGYNQTFAEMSFELRNSLSHRYHAASKLKSFLETKMQSPQ